MRGRRGGWGLCGWIGLDWRWIGREDEGMDGEEEFGGGKYNRKKILKRVGANFFGRPKKKEM